MAAEPPERPNNWNSPHFRAHLKRDSLAAERFEAGDQTVKAARIGTGFVSAPVAIGYEQPYRTRYKAWGMVHHHTNEPMREPIEANIPYERGAPDGEGCQNRIRRAIRIDPTSGNRLRDALPHRRGWLS